MVQPTSKRLVTEARLPVLLDPDLTAIAGLSPANNDVVQRKSDAWTNRTPAQLKTDLVLSKADVGLGSVDNTSDLAKPVSTATQAAIDAISITTVNADIEITDATKGVILKSANGTRYRITVADDGSLITTGI